MSQEVVVRQPRVGELARREFSTQQINVIRNTVARDATDAELGMFLEVCARYQLDPFTKQVFFMKTRGRDGDSGGTAIIVGRDGILAIANRHSDYAGHLSDVVRENDTFAVTQTKVKGAVSIGGGRWLIHTYQGNHKQRGAVIAGWCVAYRKSREPRYFYAPLEEYEPKNPSSKSPWAKGQTSVMIEKCFSSDTEVLTDRGFQRFDAVTGKVLGVTADGLVATDARPFRQDYEGVMVTLDGRDANFSVTPNHDMFTDRGVVEAGEMFERSNSHGPYGLTMTLVGSRSDAPYSDDAIALSAAYLADGADCGGETFQVIVSKPRKVAWLRERGEFRRWRTRETCSADAPIVTIAPVEVFGYDLAVCQGIVAKGKHVNTAALLAFSQRQARLFIDTLLFFDGSQSSFYTTRPEHAAAFEMAAVAAGYAVSPRRELPRSPVGTRTCWRLAISGIAFKRAARRKHPRGQLARQRRFMELTPNETGEVWCVSVPSGAIVVRRGGLSMLCGNCAISTAHRLQFEITGLYGEEESARMFDQRPEPVRGDIEWGEDDLVAQHLRNLFDAANALQPDAFTDAKIKLMLADKTDGERMDIADEIAQFIRDRGGDPPAPPEPEVGEIEEPEEPAEED